MIKQAIATGSTIDEAKNAAVAELGLTDDQTDISIQIEVIDQPEKKLLGIFGGKPAKVKVWYEVSPAKSAADYLRTIVESMGVKDFDIKIEENEDGTGASLSLEGDDLGIIIGRRGETLDAVQYLTSLVANRINSSYYRISINTGDYREKRENILESLAQRTAAKCIKYNKNFALEPMNPYERRIVHTAVQDIEGATSWSMGEEKHRHVVIGPVGLAEGTEGEKLNAFKKRNNSRGGYNNRGRSGGYNRRRPYNKGGRGGYNKHQYDRKPSSEVSDGQVVDFVREPKKEVVSAPLYGKVDIKRDDD